MKNIFSILGTNNKASYVAMAIAASKTVFRPIFTLADKKEKREVKQYTAIKEGVTEGVAIPIYASLMVMNNKLAKPLENFITKKAPDIAPKKLKNVATVMEFLGVCIAGGLIIPYASSKITNPIMNKLVSKNKKTKKRDIDKINFVEGAVVSDNPFKYQIDKNSPYLPNYNRSISYGGAKCLRL